MIIKIPPNVNSAILSLQNAGFSAFTVGGAVRDAVMGRECSDWDVATSALPEQTKAVFSDKKVIETGIKHGTVTVLLGGEPIEITTFRVDGSYTDNRHPDSVTFTARLADDLSRRDFTVNALAYNEKDGLFDFFGGMEDIGRRVIRCVGEPDKRFNEDALRIMRALRFSSVLGFSVHPDTEKSIIRNRLLLNNVSVERIASELLKLICGTDAEKIISRFPEVFDVILPEFSGAFHEHSAEVSALFGKTSPTAPERLAVLALCSGKKDTVQNAKGALRRLKLSNSVINSVLLLCSNAGKELALLPDAEFKKELGRLGEKDAGSVLRFQSALFSPERAGEALKKAQKTFSCGECITVHGLKIKGNELSKLGLAEAKSIGTTLEALLDDVLNGRVKNEKEQLAGRAAELIKLGDKKND